MPPHPDPNTPAYAENLYTIYRDYRENEPVHKETILDQSGFSLYRYDDVYAMLRDRRLRSVGISDELIAGLQGAGQAHLAEFARAANVLICVDDPDHRRIRGVIHAPLRAALHEDLQKHVERIAEELVGRLVKGTPVDLISELATPLPMMVLSKLVGFPDKDYRQLMQWADDFVSMLDASRMLGGLEAAGQAAMDFYQYVMPIVRARAKEPCDDLITALTVARYEARSISDAELVANCLFFVSAGNFTTRHLIGNAIRALLLYPEQLERLRNEPQLIPSAVEEVLRYESPSQTCGRVTNEAIRIRGVTIPEETRVRMVLGSANRDPERFHSPDEFLIARRDNRHVGFGGGIHACLGAHLGRLECSIALDLLLQRFADMRFTADRFEWLPGHGGRGLAVLPVVLH